MAANFTQHLPEGSLLHPILQQHALQQHHQLLLLRRAHSVQGTPAPSTTTGTKVDTAEEARGPGLFAGRRPSHGIALLSGDGGFDVHGAGTAHSHQNGSLSNPGSVVVPVRQLPLSANAKTGQAVSKKKKSSGGKLRWQQMQLLTLQDELEARTKEFSDLATTNTALSQRLKVRVRTGNCSGSLLPRTLWHDCMRGLHAGGRAFTPGSAENAKCAARLPQGLHAAAQHVTLA